MFSTTSAVAHSKQSFWPYGPRTTSSSARVTRRRHAACRPTTRARRSRSTAGTLLESRFYEHRAPPDTFALKSAGADTFRHTGNANHEFSCGKARRAPLVRFVLVFEGRRRAPLVRSNSLRGGIRLRRR